MIQKEEVMSSLSYILGLLIVITDKVISLCPIIFSFLKLSMTQSDHNDIYGLKTIKSL